MARAGVDGLATPHPLQALLPAVFQEDPFTGGLAAGLDEVLAPVFVTLDCLAAYVDPRLAPEDFLSWLAAWVGVELDESWPVERRRELVLRAVQILGMRGTVEGLLAQVEIFTGGVAQVSESGGVAWSQTAGGALPGEPQPRMAVRVIVDHPDAVSVRALDQLVAAAKPGHVVHQVEVVAR
jgi:phage tail-like protein